jgi:hypothetical protein
MNEYGYSELPATRFSHTINMITENEFICIYESFSFIKH